MKKDTCERCGKELGFFSRSYAVNNQKLKIQYESICSSCNRLIKQAENQFDKMRDQMIKRLREDYHVTNLAAVDLDTLIFLGVEAVVSVEPKYYTEDSAINQTIINRTEKSINRIRDLSRIVHRLIDYGFASNLANADIGSFSTYFKQNTQYFEQVQANSSTSVPRTWVNIFVSSKGLILEQVEASGFASAAFPEDKEVRFSIQRNEGIQEVRLDNILYQNNSDTNVILFFSDEEQGNRFIHTIDRYNDQLKDRLEAQRRQTLNDLSQKVRKDIRRVQPDTALSNINIDCILLCIVKGVKAVPEIPALDLYNPYGYAMDLLVKDYLSNFLVLGIKNREDMVDYIKSNCLYAEGFKVKYEDTAQEPAWAFFTPKGYILCFLESKRMMFVYEDEYPNDIYYPSNDLLYQGVRYLQLPTERDRKLMTKYRDFEGIIFFSDNIEVIGEMSRFFNRNNIFYQMDEYVAEEQRIYNGRESLLEVKRISDRLFRDFSYIPFCLYSEWAAIENAISEDDPFMSQMIDKRNNGQKKHPNQETSYTARIVDAFYKGSRDLMTSLNIDDESIAKAILWSYFNDALVDNLSAEWVRLGGDFVRSGDSLEEAFSKYAELEDIDPDKAYYLGLFIYYLVDKRVLPDDDFLLNYERALPVYVRCQRKVNYTDGVEIPAILLDDTPENVKKAAIDEKGPEVSTKLSADIDEWALTQTQADAQKETKQDKDKTSTPKMEKVSKKILNDDGDIVEVTEEVPVQSEDASNKTDSTEGSTEGDTETEQSEEKRKGEN